MLRDKNKTLTIVFLIGAVKERTAKIKQLCVFRTKVTVKPCEYLGTFNKHICPNSSSLLHIQTSEDPPN